MNWQLKRFSEFNIDELYEILKLRIDVFVVEQKCYYADLDNVDRHPETYHLFGYQAGHVVAYCRILPKNTSYTDYVSIGRVVVAPIARDKKLGHELMAEAVTSCLQLYPEQSIKISAQAHLENFYQQHQFERVTNIYLEDNIPHIGMVREF